MSNEETRRRARPMSPEERREAIVAATIPLIAETGAMPTTSEIAKAAGIAEGTVFRAFADKTELMAACGRAIFDPAPVLGGLRQVPLDLPVRERLERTVDILGTHLDRLASVGHVLRGAQMSAMIKDIKEGREDKDCGPGGQHDPRAAFRPLVEAIADLLAPDAAELRMPAGRLAGFFLSLVFSGRLGARVAGEEPVPTAELIDFFLYGAFQGRTS